MAASIRRAEHREPLPLATTTRARRDELRRIARAARGNTSTTQHRRLLMAFRAGPLTVIEAREYLDVLAFHARIAELSKAGHAFMRRWVLQATSEGHTHRVMQMALLRKDVMER